VRAMGTHLERSWMATSPRFVTTRSTEEERGDRSSGLRAIRLMTMRYPWEYDQETYRC
jgi:hypothetical protein